MSLELPHRSWKYQEWVNYVIENKDDVFKSKKGKMLKVFYVHFNDFAMEKLIADSHPTKQGDFRLITMKYKEAMSGRPKKTEYWMHEKEPGLLMFFTVSTNDAYDQTLRQKIKEQHGLHEMWIKPDSFENIRKYLVREKNGGIVKFLADRKQGEDIPSKVKEDADRHVQYRTNNPQDGVIRLDEMKYQLGIRPHSIDYMFHNSKMQITDEGMFHLKTVNKESFDLMYEVIELVRSETRQMRHIAQDLKFSPEFMNLESDERIVECGTLALAREIDVSTAKMMIKQFKRFAFIDPKIESGSLMFSSTVVDREKGSIFALSATENSITLIPRYQSTFESFLVFYQHIVEQIDPEATLNKFSEFIEPK